MSKSITLTQVVQVIEQRTLQLNFDLARKINIELGDSYTGLGYFTDVQEPVTTNDLEAIWNETWEPNKDAWFRFNRGYAVNADVIARDVMIRELYEADIKERNREICTEHISPVEDSI